MLIPVIDVEKTSLKLKELRENRKIKVSDLQRLFNMENPQSIYDWENPKKKNLPRLDNLVILAKFYNIKIDEMIVLKEENGMCVSVPDCCGNYGINIEDILYVQANASANAIRALSDFYKMKI